MRLLFDQNLSPKLPISLEKHFDEAVHVQNIGLEASDDIGVWEFAKDKQLTIVTKDSDFNSMVSLFGFPPKVIWLRKGNCSTKQLELILLEHLNVIKEFIRDNKNGILTIY